MVYWDHLNLNFPLKIPVMSSNKILNILLEQRIRVCEGQQVLDLHQGVIHCLPGYQVLLLGHVLGHAQRNSVGNVTLKSKNIIDLLLMLLSLSKSKIL